ncbi:DoxX family protein [Dyadobacter subterraneus]|uniref:DoxX family protein n=1 Tax=Dyadobacter subterraneus TaxID=2773304 RepID=A0ABR9WCB7_9BACT|nr:DoxX family protein [Dyadobacter subterraneus]MBE9462646.1 DoxX family protein [Dyadobacter subterraneus]
MNWHFNFSQCHYTFFVLLFTGGHFVYNWSEGKGAYVHMRFSSTYRVELFIAKSLGALALGIPMNPARIKGWAYAGFFIFFSCATFWYCSFYFYYYWSLVSHTLN